MAALLVIVPNWKKLKKPSKVEWINCVYSSIGLRINELLTTPNTMTNLTDDIKRERHKRVHIYIKFKLWAK